MNDHAVEKPMGRWSVLVRKDGRLHFSVDYKNAITKMDVFPLPHIDNSLDMLADTKYLTTLDLALGYWQVPMEPESKEKTVLCTPSSLYEFHVMPFGLYNVLVTLQCLVESVLAGLV